MGPDAADGRHIRIAMQRGIRWLRLALVWFGMVCHIWVGLVWPPDARQGLPRSGMLMTCVEQILVMFGFGVVRFPVTCFGLVWFGLPWLGIG